MARQALPPLTTLTSFEAAARLLSFKEAADELGVTPSAVSHQVASLERYLGVLLFVRFPGRVELSADGVFYLPAIQDALGRIAQATSHLRGAGSESSPVPLTVQVYVTVAVRWLIPRLQTFREACPNIAVNLDAGLLDWEFNPNHADAGIIYTQNPKKAGFSYTLLRQEKLVGVCSSQLAKTIKGPDDLQDVSLLTVRGNTEDAKAWAASVGVSSEAQRLAPHFDSNLLAIEAAISGQGVSVVPSFLVETDIMSGVLSVPISSNAMQLGCWYFVHLASRGNEKSIQTFLNWVVEQV